MPQSINAVDPRPHTRGRIPVVNLCLPLAFLFFYVLADARVSDLEKKCCSTARSGLGSLLHPHTQRVHLFSSSDALPASPGHSIHTSCARSLTPPRRPTPASSLQSMVGRSGVPPNGSFKWAIANTSHHPAANEGASGPIQERANESEEARGAATIPLRLGDAKPTSTLWMAR